MGDPLPGPVQARPLVFHPPVEKDAPPLEQLLYEVRRKVYPRAVSGWFARWRVALVVLTQLAFYGTAWLQWNGRQAVLFDLAARKFHIFGLVFWPQDFIYLTVLLVISALSLFLFTAIGGRLWCGYACPQTVYTEIFMWIERKVEGDRMARMRLDAQRGARWLRLKAVKHALWIALALWTGFTFVGYFTPIRTLGSEVVSLSLGPWESFWLLFYGFATYGNAGWMREQVCKYMCPYARFQSAMFDSDTLVVTYDAERGEPRGARGKSVTRAELKERGLGDCVDCGICVQVCPTGIDIRNGLQYECIGCGACIDGCNQVMNKLGYAPGLIRYSTENALRQDWGLRQMAARLVRPRVLIYSGLLALIIIGSSFLVYSRVPVKIDVIRDRTALSRQSGDGDEGRLENIYRLQLMNTREAPAQLDIAVESSSARLADLSLSGGRGLQLAAVTSRLVPLRVSAKASGESGTEGIVFVVTARFADGASYTVREKSRFFVPHQDRDERH